MEHVSIYDQSVLYGFSLFETVYVTDKSDVFLLSWHIRRLLNSAKYFDFDWEFAEDATERFVKDHICEKNLKQLVLRITLHAGNRMKDLKPSLTYTTRSYDYSKEDILKGAKLCISNIKKSQSSIILGHKTSNYLENLLVLQKAKKQGFDDALFLNEDGFVTETTKSNVFGILENRIFTPKLQCGILPGIIREWIIKNASLFGCVCMEEDISVKRLKDFEDVFITNSIFGAMHVCKIDEKIINNQKTGKVFDVIREKLSIFINGGIL